MSHMPAGKIYRAQKAFFKEAYDTGVHGWPAENPNEKVAQYIRFVAKRRKGGAVIDIGCGEGRHALYAAKLGLRVTAVDIIPKALEITRKRFRELGMSVDARYGDILKVNSIKGSFDLAIDSGCFHHIVTKDWPIYFNNIRRILSPGAYLSLSVFTTRFEHYPGESRKRKRNFIVHRKHYDHFFTEKECREALRKYGFKIIRIFKEEREENGIKSMFHILAQKVER